MRLPSDRVEGLHPLRDRRIIEPFPPKYRGLMAVRRGLILSDQLGAVLGSERAANRTRRRVHLLPNLVDVEPVIAVLCCLAAGHDHGSCFALQGETRWLPGVSRQPDR